MSIKKLSGDLSFGIASYFVKERFNNYESLDTFSSPLLLIHGQADNLIKFQHSQQLEARLKALGKTGYGEYPKDMTHNKFRFEIDLISPIRRFCDKYAPKQMLKIPLDQLPPVFLSFKSFIEKKEYEDSQLEQEKHRELESKNSQKLRLCKNEDGTPAKHSSNEFVLKHEQQKEEAESPINDITIGEYCTHFNGEYSPKKKQGDTQDSFASSNKPLFLKANSTLAQENQTEFTASIEKKLPSRTSSSLSLDKKNSNGDKKEQDKRDNEIKLERSRQIEKYLNYQKKKKCEPCYIHPVRIEEIEEENQNHRLTRLNGNQKASSIPPKEINGGSSNRNK